MRRALRTLAAIAVLTVAPTPASASESGETTLLRFADRALAAGDLASAASRCSSRAGSVSTRSIAR